MKIIAKKRPRCSLLRFVEFIKRDAGATHGRFENDGCYVAKISNVSRHSKMPNKAGAVFDSAADSRLDLSEAVRPGEGAGIAQKPRDKPLKTFKQIRAEIDAILRQQRPKV